MSIALTGIKQEWWRLGNWAAAGCLFRQVAPAVECAYTGRRQNPMGGSIVTNASSHRGSSAAIDNRLRFVVSLSAAALCVVVGLWFVLFSALPGGTSTVQAATLKGVVDWQLEQNPIYPPLADAAITDKLVAEMSVGTAGVPGLHARWTRLLVYWDSLQPKAPGASGATYNQVYMSRLKMIVSKFHAASINVIVTPVSVPRWASDSSLWSSPPQGSAPGYQPSYAMNYKSSSVMAGFQNMAKYLASQLGPLGAGYYEVWNEPNISRMLYPQRRGHAYPDYGMRVYRAMLVSYWKGIKSAKKSYTVIAGGTAPYGNNSTGATSPNVWANNLRKNGMSKYFDAYSHHPYQVLGSVNTAPNQMPSDPAHMVNLANLSVLLNMFPSKPFYITEYGYGTGFNPQFGIQVSEATQAAYLTKAYAMARSHKQVKALIWYMLRDWAPNPAKPNTGGVYTGLMKVDGTLKKSWSAFARVP